MGKKASPAVIGAFVIGAVALSVLAVTIWGSGQLFRRHYAFICYFPGSVNGLAQGAPVKFRGVQIGQVTDIRLLHHQRPATPRIPVFLELDADRMRELGMQREATPEVVRELIGQGLRARLQTLSIVTGVLYVDFDILPGTQVELVQPPDDTPMEIPTLRTPLEEATRTISDVLTRLKEVDFKAIGAGVQEAVGGMNRLANNPRLIAAIDSLPATVESAHRLLANVDTRTGDLSDDAHHTLASLRTTLDSVRGTVASDAPLSVGLVQTATDLGQAARAIRDLADFLERNPNALVFGRREP